MMDKEFNHLSTLDGKRVPEILLYYRPGNTTNVVQTDNPKTAYKAFLEDWDKRIIRLQMQTKVMFLNGANFPLGIYTHSTGLSGHTPIDIRIVMGAALKANARSLILASNRPNCILQPSDLDQELFSKLSTAAEYFDIKVLDFLLLSEYDCFSFTQNDLLGGY